MIGVSMGDKMAKDEKEFKIKKNWKLPEYDMYGMPFDKSKPLRKCEKCGTQMVAKTKNINPKPAGVIGLCMHDLVTVASCPNPVCPDKQSCKNCKWDAYKTYDSSMRYDYVTKREYKDWNLIGVPRACKNCKNLSNWSVD